MYIRETCHTRVCELINQILYQFVLLLLVKTMLQSGHNFAELSWRAHKWYIWLNGQNEKYMYIKDNFHKISISGW